MTKTIGSLVVGDFNLARGFVEDLAGAIGGDFVVGNDPDHAILSGDAQLVQVVRNLPPGGSDHAPILLEVMLGGERVRVLWWNVYVGQDPGDVLAQVLNLAGLARPDIIALGEAYRCRKVLGRVPGYRRRQPRRGEGSELAVLTRRGLTVTYSGRLRMRERWIGPKHALAHHPREYPRLRIRLRRGVVLCFLPVHLPTGGSGGRNRAAVLESVDRITRWGRGR